MKKLLSAETFLTIVNDVVDRTSDKNNFILKLWRKLTLKDQIKALENAERKHQHKIIVGLFLHISFEMLDMLIPDRLLSIDFDWEYIRDAEGNDAYNQDNDYPEEYQSYDTYITYYGPKPLIFVAVEEDRVDLIEYLLGRRVNIDYEVLVYMSRHDKLKLVINSWNLYNKRNVCKLLSACRKVDDIAYLASKGIFIGYELTNFAEYGLSSPIDNFIKENIEELPELVGLGIVISPDASDYLERYKDQIIDASPEITRLFYENGGDLSILE